MPDKYPGAMAAAAMQIAASPGSDWEGGPGDQLGRG